MSNSDTKLTGKTGFQMWEHKNCTGISDADMENVPTNRSLLRDLKDSELLSKDKTIV